MRRLAWFCFCLLLACNVESNISREYRCNFIFDTSLHPMPCQLTAILGNSGQFVKVEGRLVQGVQHWLTTRNYDNATEDIVLRTEKERQVSYALGAAGSLIIGLSAYDHALRCWDGQCPNCLADLSGTTFPLVWQKNGLQLYCANCHRSYDVNNGVVAAGEGGRQLMQYATAFDGTVLRAWN